MQKVECKIKLYFYYPGKNRGNSVQNIQVCKFMFNTKQANRIKRCYIQKTYRYLTICFVFVLFLICEISMAVGSCELKIFTRNSKINLNDVKAFFKNADLITSRMLPAKKANKKILPVYTIVLMNDKDFKRNQIIDKKGKGIRYYLPEDTNKWVKNDRIKAKIIASMILKKANLNLKANYKKLPPWLVYGILSKVKRRLNKATIPGITTFPAIHMLVTTSSPPDLLEIVSKPLRSGDGPIYQIFLEASEIIVDSIRRLPKSRESIIDVINLSVKGYPTKEAFIQAFAKKIYILRNNTTESIEIKKRNSSEVMHQWLLENALLMAVNTFKPGNAYFAEKQFRKVEIVKYIATPDNEEAENKEERYCQVNELQAKKKEMDNFNAILREKELAFARLAFSIPALLQPGILKIKRSLEMLRAGNIRNFKEEHDQAKKEFYTGLDKMNKLEVYLSKLELESLPESWKYRYELKELAKWDKKKRKRWPALTRYFDAIENK